MKKSLLKLSLILSLLTMGTNAYSSPDRIHDFASSIRSSGPDGWYDVSTDSYPKASALSLNGSHGVSSGSVFLSPTGIILGDDGDYHVSISAILTNPDEESRLIIPVFLSVREQGQSDETEIDAFDQNPIGGVGIVSADNFTTINGQGILKNARAGTRLSLVVTNGGYETPQTIKVIGWTITATLID